MPAHAEPVSSGLSKSKKNLLTLIVPSYTGVLTHIYSPSPPAGTTLSEMPSAMALLDAQVRQLASNRDNTSGSQATEIPPTQRAGTENSQNAVSEAAEGQTTSMASLLDMVLSSPVEQGRPANPGTSSLVSLGEGLPLIPRKMVEKIQAGDYVDFSDMPPAKGKARSLPPHWEGHILVVQLEDLEGSKRLIPDFQMWVQCVSMYAAVVVARHPDKFMPLMAYLTDMAKNANGHLGWSTTRILGCTWQPQQERTGQA